MEDMVENDRIFLFTPDAARYPDDAKPLSILAMMDLSEQVPKGTGTSGEALQGLPGRVLQPGLPPLHRLHQQVSGSQGEPIPGPPVLGDLKGSQPSSRSRS